MLRTIFGVDNRTHSIAGASANEIHRYEGSLHAEAS